MHATLTLPASAHALDQLTAFLDDLLSDVRVELHREIALAVHELCANIVRYAGAQQIIVTGERTTDTLFLTLIDDGKFAYEAPPEITAPDIDGLPESGWGMVILHHVMDSVEYHHSGDGNEWRLCKQLTT